jgi:predicted HicB family RNase H-like nuclease
MSKKKVEKDTRLFMRISTELKTKIIAQAKSEKIPVSKFVLNAIKMQLDK